MSRTQFINELFDNGNGLTLDQIQDIENYLPGTIPEDMPLDSPESLAMARDVFMGDLHSHKDLLEIRSFLRNYISHDRWPTDYQVYRMSLIK